MLDIVPMTMDDIPAVVRIEQNSQLEPWHELFFMEELDRPQSHTFVARLTKSGASSRVVGYVCFWLVADELQVLNIAVDPAHRRGGIGRALLRQALAVGYRHQARVAMLEVRRSNEAAQGLYRSLGFLPVGERKDYYGGVREPAILMELEMNRECSRE